MDDEPENGDNGTFSRHYRKRINRDGIDLNLVADINVSRGDSQSSTSFASSTQNVSITQTRGKNTIHTSTSHTTDSQPTTGQDDNSEPDTDVPPA